MSRRPTLFELAREVGIAVNWTNAANERQRVTSDTLRNVLMTLGFVCDTPAQIAESYSRVVAERTSRPQTFITSEVGKEILLPIAGSGRAKLILEHGSASDIAFEERENGCAALPAIGQPGYHMLSFGDRTITLAVAPARCFTIADAAPDSALWGLAVQVYGLRRPGDSGIGDTGAASQLAEAAAALGADAIALSPMHALFSAQPWKFSPYSPSNRLMLNPLLADPAALFGTDRVAAAAKSIPARESFEPSSLIDWPAAAALKLELFGRLFEDFLARSDAGETEDFLAFRRAGGNMLEYHARFEALQADQVGRGRQYADWQNWPPELRDPTSAAVEAFAQAHERDVHFHRFLQWVADRALADAQARSKQAGMRIGLIADLAVGTEAGGSHAWAQQADVLLGLSVGAPPDAFNPHGQNWGLTTISPQALHVRDFEPFLAMLRAMIRHAGGVRLDHVMGLRRLWVIPAGATPNEGAYLTYPFDDLLRLVRLESFRHRAIVIGEDLGTVPAGLRKALAESGIAGMDVLWFARKGAAFLAPGRWREDALAMTSTHDLPTIAGWWAGKDILARQTLGHEKQSKDESQRQRADDREQLCQAFRNAGALPNGEPLLTEASRVVDAAVAYVAKTPAPAALIPLEDMLGLEEQPNLPGSIDEYPNWRRRYPLNVDEIFSDPAVSRRAKTLANRTSS